jgi:hypothetical protein
MTRKINCNWETETPVSRDVWLRNECLRQQKAAEAQVQMKKKEDVDFVQVVEGVIFKTAAAQAEYTQYQRVRSEAKYGHMCDAEYVAYAEYKQMPKGKAKTAAYAEYMKQYGKQRNAIRELELRAEKAKAYAEKNKVAVITATQKREDNMAWDESIRNSISKGYDWS